MKKYFFLTVSTLLLISSFVAFSDNLITDVGQESNSDPKFIVHGLIMFAWFGTFVTQTYFITQGKIAAHIKWGKIGMIIAIGVFLSTLWVFIAVFKSWEAMEPFVKANRLFMLSFAAFLFLAYKNTTNPEKHKRFIYLAIIPIIEPIMGRVSERLLVDNWELFYILVWNGFFLALFMYDWISLKRIHLISWIGLVWFYLVWAFSILS